VIVATSLAGRPVPVQSALSDSQLCVPRQAENPGDFTMPNSDTATATLEERVRAIEDRLAIYNLIASHPPSADTGADYYTRAGSADDGVSDRGPHAGGSGNETIAAVVKPPEHQAAISGGLAHFCALPYIELDGDRAAVTSYLQILMPDPNGVPVELSNHGTSK